MAGRLSQTFTPQEKAGNSLYVRTSELSVQDGQEVVAGSIGEGSFFDRLVELLKRYYHGEL
ncbi:MAG: hypothetical protein ACUVTA_02100 [Thermodesulfitimonas sp.]